MFPAADRSAAIVLTTAIVTGFTLVGPSTSVASATSGGCSSSNASQPFLPWGDPASYELFRGGDFEHAVWTLSGGATRVRGSEPYAATGTLGKWSLSMPSGSVAKSPAACVSVTEPTIRTFISGSGTIAVAFVYGGVVIPSGVIVGGGPWAPTPIVLTGSAITLGSNGTANVSAEFTALTGDAKVDDVFIDPWNRG